MDAHLDIENYSELMELTADIVSSHLSHNTVSTSDIPAFISAVYDSLAKLGQVSNSEQPKPEPAVAVRQSVKNDYIVCLEDGTKLKMLKRYLKRKFDLSPEEYRTKWGLPRDYPMIAPGYAEQRRGIAHQIGLGRKPKTIEAPAITEASTMTKPRRKLKIAAPEA